MSSYGPTKAKHQRIGYLDALNDLLEKALIPNQGENALGSMLTWMVDNGDAELRDRVEAARVVLADEINFVGYPTA